MKYLKTIIFTSALLSLFCACSAVKKCNPPQLNLPETIVPGGGDSDSLTIADIEWWKFYGDSILCGIISRTLENNHNIQAAASHIEQLRELYRIRKADLLPSVNISATADNETNDYAGEPFKRDPE